MWSSTRQQKSKFTVSTGARNHVGEVERKLANAHFTFCHQPWVCGATVPMCRHSACTFAHAQWYVRMVHLYEGMQTPATNGSPPRAGCICNVDCAPLHEMTLADSSVRSQLYVVWHEVYPRYGSTTACVNNHNACVITHVSQHPCHTGYCMHTLSFYNMCGTIVLNSI